MGRGEACVFVCVFDCRPYHLSHLSHNAQTQITADVTAPPLHQIRATLGAIGGRRSPGSQNVKFELGPLFRAPV